MKYVKAMQEIVDDYVRPLAGAGIEISSYRRATDEFAFAPSRGRELKLPCPSVLIVPEVRPLAGAGIEMSCGNGLRLGLLCSPPRGGGN